MINLYEFLGIAPTNDKTLIEASINTAEKNGKDSKLIMASRNFLLHAERKAKHDAYYGIQFEEINQTDVEPKISEAKATMSGASNRVYEKLKNENGMDTIELIAWGVFLLSLVGTAINFIGIFFYSGSSMSEFGKSIGAASKFMSFGIWSVLFGLLATFSTVRRKLNFILSKLD